MTHTEFKRRFLPLQKMLYREAFRMLCDSFEAEDAVQNLYLKLWERKDELKNIGAHCQNIIQETIIKNEKLV